MLKLDNNLLDELGLSSLPDEQKRAMLQHIYETLELRVGTNLANQMSDQQLEEFEKFIDEGGDANQEQALHWLETNLPNYKEVVNQVFEALKGEIKQMAPQLVAASAQQVPASTAPADPGAYGGQPAPQPAYQPPADQGSQSYGAPEGPQGPQTPAGQPVSDPFAQPQQPPAADPFSAQPPAATPAPDPMQPPQPGLPPQQPPSTGYQPAPQGFQPPQPPQSV